MAERFEFEVVASDGSIVENDNAADSVRPDKSDKDKRVEENQQFRREANKRANDKENDRVADRKARLDKLSSKDEEAREKNLTRLRDAAHRKKVAQERAIVTEQNRGQTLRRRFINDFFGAFNSAHFGRRVNHLIDFVRSLSGGFNTAVSPTGLGVTGSVVSSTVRETINKTNNTSKERENNSSTQSSKERLARDIARDTIRDRISSRRAAGTASQFSRVSNRVGTARAAQLFGSRAISNIGSIIGRVSSVLGKLGPVGLAAGAGLIAITGGALGAAAAFVALNSVTGRLIRSIEGIPSPVLFAQIETRFEILNAKFQRADRLGENLARIERVQGANTVKGFSLVDNVSSPLLPITESLNRLFGVGLDFLNLVVRIDSKVGFLSQIESLGNNLNLLLDIGNHISGKFDDSAEALVNFSGPVVGAAFKAAGFFDDEKAKNGEGELSGGNIMRDLFQAMNNPVGDIKADFELGFGNNEIANVFEGL